LVLCPKKLIPQSSILLFPEKEAKSVVPLRGRQFLTQTSAKPTQGLVLCPKKLIPQSSILLFPEKEAKSVVPLRGRYFLTPNFGEADPGGLGACPQKRGLGERFVSPGTQSVV
jgi:hypothetical protein